VTPRASQKCAEGLAGRALERDVDRVLRQALVAVALGHLAESIAPAERSTL
jgi:hypothetical protein